MTYQEIIDITNNGGRILCTQDMTNAKPRLFVIGKNNLGQLIQVKAGRCCGYSSMEIDERYINTVNSKTSRTYELITTDTYNSLFSKYGI